MLFWAVNSVFVLFALLNINDPDWFIWVPTYFLVVASTAAYRENKIKKKTINKVLLYLLFVFIISFFGFVEVFDNNSDTMVNMNETKREAVGALIAMAWVFWASRE